jgi:predicted tellurium resistance membrane protein TerC
VSVGVAVLAWTAAKMIVEEPLFADFFATNRAAAYAIYVAVFAGVFGAGWIAARRRRMAQA